MAQDGTLPVRGRQMSQNNKSNNRRRSKSQSGKNGDAPNKRAADTVCSFPISPQNPFYQHVSNIESLSNNIPLNMQPNRVVTLSFSNSLVARFICHLYITDNATAISCLVGTGFHGPFSEIWQEHFLKRCLTTPGA
jgi:hypothetical protein